MGHGRKPKTLLQRFFTYARYQQFGGFFDALTDTRVFIALEPPE
jgi:hypothetical protein